MSPKEWIPLRWYSGPLETALRRDVTSDEKQALSASHEPAGLAPLEGSPFNCLVLSFAAGKPEDAEQQKTLAPLVGQAKKRGLAVLGRITGADPGKHLGAAQSAGLDGVLTDKAVSGSPLPAFPLMRAGDASVGGDSPLVPLKGCEWPSVRLGRGGNAEAGPTGYPWVDSNGWKLHLARSIHPGAMVWSTAEPKRAGTPVRPDIYALAVADAAAYGARWLAALDPITQAGLLRSTGEAREAWTTMLRSVRFFEERRRAGLSEGAVISRFGVWSEFSGPVEALAGEALNLSIRRQLPVRVLPAGATEPSAYQGLRAIAAISATVPSAATIGPMLEAGATVIVSGNAIGLASGLTAAGVHENGYRLFRSGKGTLAVAPAEWTDPYLIVQDSHRILSRASDVVRLWNAGSSISFPVAKGEDTTVHVLNYSGRPTGLPMSLWIARPYREARGIDLSGKAEVLQAEKKGEGTEVKIPVFTSYTAVEFRGRA